MCKLMTFIGQVVPQQSTEVQKDEAPEFDHPEPQHLVQLHMTKAKDASAVTPQTFDDHSESELQTPAAGLASSSYLLSN